jgi:SPOR domain
MFRLVTGHAPDEWRIPQFNSTNLNLPVVVPCPQIVKLFSAERITRGKESIRTGAADAPPRPTWGVQLTGDSSQGAALAAFYKMQKIYFAVLGSHAPLVLRSPAGRNASWYRVRVSADTRGAAERLCSSLRAAGGTCVVQMN